MKIYIFRNFKKYSPAFYLACYLIAICLTASCKQVEPENPSYSEQEKTILVYMVANNNLSGNSVNNLNDLTKGYIPDNGNLIVYQHLYNKSAFLFKVYKQDGKVAIDTVYRFPKDLNSSKTTSLVSTMNIVKTMFPANKYGLILWSHGTGWLPKGYYEKGSFPSSKSERSASSFKDPFAHMVKSFGSEKGEEMEIIELARAIPYKQEFIIFDACLMGCIEVTYELKDKTDYFIASPTEILTDGFPYNKIMQHLFKPDADVVATAKEYYDYYNSKTGIYQQSGTIAVIKSSELNNLAAATKKIFDTDRANIQNLNLNNVQPYFRYNKHWFYDLTDFISQISTNSANLDEFNIAMSKAIIYKAATDMFIDLPIVKFSGISTYIPKHANAELDSFYSNFAWNKACEMVK